MTTKVKINGETVSYDELLTPEQVARMWGVDPKTVTRWARLDRFLPGTVVWTPGGHRRYRRPLVELLLNGGGRP